MPVPETPAEIVDQIARVADRNGRVDLAQRLRTGRERAARPETVVCVVGEFKQGKSSLINALLEASICPVDDDLATAVPTVLCHGPETSITVHARVEGRAQATNIEPADLSDWVTESGNPDNERGVEQVEIRIDHPVLAEGLVLIDTPGVGGLGAGHAVAAAAFLPYADALVFVSDASTELTAPEIEFLLEATEACPQVVVAITKTDLYPSWRQIVELDRGHLGAAGHAAPLLPVSADGLAAGLQLGDDQLVVESGIPALRELLLGQVLDPGRDRAARLLLTECESVLGHLEALTGAELDVIRDPASLEQAREHYATVAARLQQQRESGARWQQVLNDGVTDLSSQVTFRFRADLRRVGQETDAQIEELRTPEQWDALAESLQRQVAQLVGDLLTDLDSRTDELAGRVRDLLRDEIHFTGVAGRDEQLPTLADSNLQLPEQAGGFRRAGSGAMGAMRGAQSGLLLFGLLGRYLPVGAAAIMFSNPVTLVLGAAFAGKQVRDVRRQSLTARRQQARSAVRSFLDAFQLEASNRLAEVMRERSRALRDHFVERVAELQATAQALAEQAQRDVGTIEADHAQRGPALESQAAELAALRPRMTHVIAELERRQPHTAPAPVAGPPFEVPSE